VNWIEYFGGMYIAQAVDRVRQVFVDKGYEIRVNGRFVVLQVGDVKEIISRYSKSSPEYSSGYVSEMSEELRSVLGSRFLELSSEPITASPNTDIIMTMWSYTLE